MVERSPFGDTEILLNTAWNTWSWPLPKNQISPTDDYCGPIDAFDDFQAWHARVPFLRFETERIDEAELAGQRRG